MVRAKLCSRRCLAAALPVLLYVAFAGLADAVPVPAATADQLWRKVAEDDNVQFHLYTREHPQTHKRLDIDHSTYDVHRPTVLMAHGYLGCGSAESIQMVRNAVLGAEDVQFVAVHWERLADGHYEHAAANTTVVAARVAALLDALTSGLGARLRDFHLVGFSLGAQVMAQVRRTLKAGILPRITALDPARPMFDLQPPEGRLDASDADLVVVLHTAGGKVSFTEPLGHVDFYPNNGTSPQPPCRAEFFPLLCSHMVAPEYLAESVRRPGSFAGRRCTSWEDFVSGDCGDEETATLGLFHNYTTLGNFYLHSSAQQPYGLGTDGARHRRAAFLNNASSSASPSASPWWSNLVQYAERVRGLLEEP